MSPFSSPPPPPPHQVPSPLQTAVFNGISTELYPRVVLGPAFAPSLADIKVCVRGRGGVLGCGCRLAGLGV